jgi:DNA-binding XRE family transcriptional regulator
MTMPFEKVDYKKYIEDLRNSDPDFKEAWDSSRMECAILGELNKLRKQKGITQGFIAEKTGIKQQVISRIEKRESSPTLKTLCALADTLDVDIRLVPRHP